MTPQELRELCTKRQPFGGVFDQVYIKMPGKPDANDSRTLAGKGSPRGKVAGDAPGGGIVVQFKASEILAWLDKMEARDNHQPPAQG